jgi:hypothetical protein
VPVVSVPSKINLGVRLILTIEIDVRLIVWRPSRNNRACRASRDALVLSGLGKARTLCCRSWFPSLRSHAVAYIVYVEGPRFVDGIIATS